MGMENLTLIGTSHIAIESVKEVRKVIEETQPNLVAVELDKRRLVTLLAKKKPTRFDLSLVRKIGVKGFLFMVVAAWFQKKLGKLVKLEPGADMKTAVLTAKKHDIQVALIDQDITKTLARLSKFLTWKERFRFVADIVKGVIFPKRVMKEVGLEQMDLTAVPTKQTITRMMTVFKDRYPSVFRVLVHERNVIMARRLYRLLTQRPAEHIVAVVGAGHEEEILRMINDLYNANGGVTYTHSVSV